MIQKILELKGVDFMKGLSIKDDYALGGLFQTANNFDPFESMGYAKPSLIPVQLGSGTITTQVNYLTSFGSGSEGYVYALGDRSGTGQKCFYRIKLSDQTIIDYSDKIDQDTLTGAVSHYGLTTYKNRIIYEEGGNIRSNSLVPTTGNDTLILSTSGTAGANPIPVSFFKGSDGNLYYTANDNASIGKIVLVTGTSGNVNNAFSFTDTSMVPKDGCNDGIYTIFIADNNVGKTTLANSSCRIFFWDTIKSKADIIWDIPDSYLISCKYVDGKVLILGASGLWICNSVTPPKLIFPLTSIRLPSSSNQVTQQGNILYWGATGVDCKIFAYGSKIGKPIIFSPFETTTLDNLHTALVASGTYFVASVDAGTNTPKTYLLNSGTTRSQLTIRTATLPLTQPFKLAYTKVVLKEKLSSGQEVGILVYNGNNLSLSDQILKTYTTDGAKQTLIFPLNLGASTIKTFEEISLLSLTIGGATIQRVSVFGEPIDDYSQII